MDVDPRRFGAYAGKNYTRLKNEEAYEHVFVIHYPDEERPAGRPLKTSPIHDLLDSMGAVWGQRYGWERPNWFAPEGVERRDVWSFRRSNYFEHVGNECRNIRDNVGIIDITSFAKFKVAGPGAEAYLDRLVCRWLPAAVGRINLSHALTRRGGVRSEFTIMRDGRREFYLVSSGAAERYDHDYLFKNLPEDGSVRLENLTTSIAVLVLAGPNARAVLQCLTDADLSNDSFKWLTGQHINVGLAPVRAMRINFVGELGWELHHPIEYQRHIFGELMRAGAAFDIGQCGMRAMDSLRIEKSYRMWGQDLTRDYTVLEAGLDRFVHLDKGDFVGRDALIAQADAGVPRRFVTVEALDVEDADPIGNEPLWQGQRMVGRVTAGAYGHFLGRSLALAYVEAGVGSRLEIEILGRRYPAMVIEDSPHDPENARPRA
jgi:dimethylglycine dehydrogenase